MQETAEQWPESPFQINFAFSNKLFTRKLLNREEHAEIRSGFEKGEDQFNGTPTQANEAPNTP
jgi:hypothetical protein